MRRDGEDMVRIGKEESIEVVEGRAESFCFGIDRTRARASV